MSQSKDERRTKTAPTIGRVVLVHRRPGWGGGASGGPRAALVNSCNPDTRPHPLVNVTVLLAPFDAGTREALARDGMLEAAAPAAVEALRELPLYDAGHPGIPDDAMPETWAEWPPRLTASIAEPGAAVAGS